MTKKEFALKAIAPYFKNPEICGYNSDERKCKYLTEDGRKCVVGQFLKNPDDYKDVSLSAAFLMITDGDNMLVEDARGILTSHEWGQLQIMHDSIAKSKSIKYSLERLGLFTQQELIDYANTL